MTETNGNAHTNHAEEPPKRLPDRPTRVVITGLDIPFFNLVGMLVKISIATIPAAAILTVIGMFFMGIMAGHR